MIDPEVQRLRQLRNASLRLRAMARELTGHDATRNEPLLNAAACAAWRVVRTVTGRLRAHPFAAFQQDASLGVLVANALAAKASALTATNRLQVLKTFEKQVRIVSRRLDDARALSWAADFSDLLGRSQIEIRALAAATEEALYASCQGYVRTSVGQGSFVRGASTQDWPFVAL